MDIQTLGKAQYIALESFRKNGTGVITPLWVAEDQGKLYVWTGANSWKVKRIRRNSRVKLCQSDARGTPKSSWVEAQATILADDQDVADIEQLIKAKYGFMMKVTQFMGSLTGQPKERVGIEITLS